jgi:hypothetical protein
MKKSSILFAVIILIVQYSCDIPPIDTTDEVWGRYQIRHMGGGNNSLLGKNEISANIVDFEYDDSFLVIKQKPNVETIKIYLENDIITHYYNDSVSKTRPVDTSIYRGNHYFIDTPDDHFLYQKLRSQHVSTQGHEADGIQIQKLIDSFVFTQGKYKRLFAHKYNFWIIVNSSDLMYDPLTESEYLQKRIELKVSNGLKCDDDKWK